MNAPLTASSMAYLHWNGYELLWRGRLSHALPNGRLIFVFCMLQFNYDIGTGLAFLASLCATSTFRRAMARQADACEIKSGTETKHG